MKNNMNIIHILFGIVLILLVLIQTYNSVKAESHRQELQQLCDFLQSRKDTMDSLISRFDGIFSEMETENQKNSVLKKRIVELETIVGQLEDKRNALELANLSMERTRDELLKCNGRLASEVKKVREEIQQGKDSVQCLERQVGSLNKIKTEFEIAMGKIRAEVIPYLSTPVTDMDIPTQIINILKSQGIRYVGELIAFDKYDLLDIKGIGWYNLEYITQNLHKHCVCLGMDVVRIGNRWYRIDDVQTVEQAQEQTTE